MEKQLFKQKVIDWLKENNIDLSKKKIRVLNYRGDLEVRIYGEPILMLNNRKSFRERKDDRDTERHGTYGIHSRMISNYIHINQKDFDNKEEKEFILQTFKYQFN